MKDAFAGWGLQKGRSVGPENSNALASLDAARDRGCESGVAFSASSKAQEPACGKRSAARGIPSQKPLPSRQSENLKNPPKHQSSPR